MVEGEGALEPVSGDVAGVPVPPTLLTSTSIREQRWRIWWASRRTSAWGDRSATNTSTGSPSCNEGETFQSLTINGKNLVTYLITEGADPDPAKTRSRYEATGF